MYVETDIMPLFEGKSYEDAVEQLKAIIEAKHIKFHHKFDEIIIDPSGGQTPGKQIGLSCEITFEGMDFLIRHSAFQNSKDSIRTQRIFNRLSNGLLAVSILASGIFTYLSLNNTTTLVSHQQEIDSLKSESKILRDSLSIVKGLSSKKPLIDAKMTTPKP
ncbi:hypothetical protein SAMN05421821_106173 [Mucilaginibacter lappiensis]|nr:hypothetical protein SAMN05421821_106173 [Mucilaginibacter lappiensis]